MNTYRFKTVLAILSLLTFTLSSCSGDPHQKSAKPICKCLEDHPILEPIAEKSVGLEFLDSLNVTEFSAVASLSEEEKKKLDDLSNSLEELVNQHGMVYVDSVCMSYLMCAAGSNASAREALKNFLSAGNNCPNAIGLLSAVNFFEKLKTASRGTAVK